ncbi:MAG TPA: class I SAM-dependent methyltransferase [Baekduia sp.]|nr:class I SAM-dependent methyltransferase [Baekduia sp.]
MSAADVWARCGAVIYDPFLALAERRGMAARRRDLLARAEGRVLEIGAGTGLNVPHYPGHVEQLVLTEPELGMRKRLERRVERAGRDAQVVGAGAEQLPFEDDSFDHVVSTMVLCTVPEPRSAIAEIRRVLRPGGRLLFAEHLRAHEPRLARWQDRLEAPWRGFAFGCRCNQPTLDLLAEGGLQVEVHEHGRWHGMPPLVAPLAVGSASA